MDNNALVGTGYEPARQLSRYAAKESCMPELLKTRRNDVLSEIRRMKLEPTRFEWHVIDSEARDGGATSALIYQGVECFFVFDAAHQELISRRKPGRVVPIERHRHASWEDQLAEVRSWLEIVKAEDEAPDWWQLAKDQEPLHEVGSNYEDNRPLTLEQQQSLVELIPEIKEFIARTVQPTAEKLDHIEKQLDYLVSASSRLGSKDFILIFISLITNIISGLALDPVKSAQVYDFCSSVLSQALKGIKELPEVLKLLLK